MLTRLRQRRRAHDDQRGFTLVELLVVMVIFGIVGTVVMASIIGAINATSKGEERVHAYNDLQRGLERVGRELRAASPLRLDPSGNYRDAVGARIVRGGEPTEYRYYLADAGDGTTELREDVRRYDDDGESLIEVRSGLFIANVGNLEPGVDVPMITYYRQDDATNQLVEIDCDGISDSQCRDRHATASQIRIRLVKTLPDQDPVEVQTVVNIRNTRLSTGE
jgi:prepilin-type N-terminal cleavage/methylation domain-containing protein